MDYPSSFLQSFKMPVLNKWKLFDNFNNSTVRIKKNPKKTLHKFQGRIFMKIKVSRLEKPKTC